MSFMRKHLLLVVLMASALACGKENAAKGTATLSWDAPATSADGTPLTDLAGYKAHYGSEAGKYVTNVDVGNVTTYTVKDLKAGTYYFAVTAYDADGNESTFSNEATKKVQ